MSAMVFRNYGGDYQLRLETPDDLRNILELEEARWAVTSAPTSGLTCDPVFLDFLDTDDNGRVRTDEIREAVDWLFRMLTDLDRLVEGSDALRLNDIDASHDEGQRLRAAAERILRNLGLADATEITLAQVRDRKAIMSRAASNGDGVIPPEATDDEETAAFIRAIIAHVGGEVDANGATGVTDDILKKFISEATEFLAWEAKGRTESDVLPWGDETGEAWRLVSSLDAKLRQYFSQCALARYDNRAGERLRLKAEELDALDVRDPSAILSSLDAAPLAAPSADGSLNLDGEINPRFRAALEELSVTVLGRALGESVRRVDAGQWERVLDTFAVHAAWLADKRGASVEELGREKLEGYLEGTVRAKVAEMIAADRAAASEIKEVSNLEKLILYQQLMLGFTNSFVSFPPLYDPSERSLFEAGTLIIDGRELTFAVRVDDRKKHKAIAENSHLHALYVEVTGKDGEDKSFEAVAAVTAGDSVGLWREKRGIFFTTDGREWDARVVDIIENPVSLSEALKAPFLKAWGFVTQQVEKFGKAQQTKIESAISTSSGGGKGTAAARDLLLGGSIALAALSSSFAYVTKALSAVEPLEILAVLVSLLAIVFGPTALLGYIRLRQRDLTTLLEASGWSINIRMRLTGSLGKLFTREPSLPKGASLERRDLVGKFAHSVGVNRVNWARVTILTLLGALTAFIYMERQLLIELQRTFYGE